jgi:hypothetical protein
MAFNEVWGIRADRPARPFYVMATEDGMPGSNCDMLGNYAAEPKDFWIQAPEGQIYFGMLAALFLTLTNVRDKNQYGEILLGLTNGVLFIYERGGIETVLNPKGPIKTNAELVTSGWMPLFSELNGNNDLFVFEFFFKDHFGAPQTLYGNVEDKFIVRLNDDFSTLTTHCFAISGLRQEA